MLRRVAEEIAHFIREDEVLKANAHLTVAVEDKASVAFEIERALGLMGVFVLVSVLSFRRVDCSPILQGTIEFQISCFENPEINRDDLSIMTAQGVAERLADILHYTKFNTLTGPMLFKEFSRDDTDEVNIVRGNYEAHGRLVDDNNN